MEIHVHIDRLVLEDDSLGFAGRKQIAAALQAELGRLLTEGGLHQQWATGGSVAQLRAGEMTWAGAPTEIGAGLAQTIFRGGLGPAGDGR